MLIQELKKEHMTHEYGCTMRRVYPNVQTDVPTPFGSAWAIVEVNNSSAPHNHHEAETFYITAGTGTMVIDDERSDVKQGDVVFIPPFKTHQLINTGDADLVFVCTWWETEQGEQAQ